MIRSFRVKGVGDPFEQDVKVTKTEVLDIPIEVGDVVSVLCTAKVAAVYGERGTEVDLSNLTPVKVTGVARG